MKDGTTARQWALFKDGRQISKSHSTAQAAFVEAFECGAMTRGTPDFPGDFGGNVTVALAEGYSVREVAP